MKVKCIRIHHTYSHLRIKKAALSTYLFRIQMTLQKDNSHHEQEVLGAVLGEVRKVLLWLRDNKDKSCKN
ncbi:hypothetical protein CVS40_9063 [Lucilia cuprina]|nr:hypothetical protein CVS40_9063 [Lucilia cuprina]